MRVELQYGTGDPDTNITNDDLVTTGKIALAHLNEIPDYYTRLAAMEAEGTSPVERLDGEILTKPVAILRATFTSRPSESST